MKILIFSKILALSILMLAQHSIAEGVEGHSKFTNFNLKNCYQKKCIQVIAESAESGNLSALLSLKNINITLLNNGKKTNIQGSFGYLDFEQNVVFIKLNKKKEMTISLRDLLTKEYSL